MFKGRNHNLTYPIAVSQFLVPSLLSFVAIDRKGHFDEILSRVFKFGCFSEHQHF